MGDVRALPVVDRGLDQPDGRFDEQRPAPGAENARGGRRAQPLQRELGGREPHPGAQLGDQRAAERDVGHDGQHADRDAALRGAQPARGRQRGRRPPRADVGDVAADEAAERQASATRR